MGWYVQDQLGTPFGLVDQTGSLAWESRQQSFGESVTLANGNTSNNTTQSSLLRFPGQQADAETGYRQNYFRDYNPAQGRYIESDPIGLRGGINTYAYVSGSPTSLIDPHGTTAVEWELVNGGGILEGILGGGEAGGEAGTACGPLCMLGGAVAGGLIGGGLAWWAAHHNDSSGSDDKGGGSAEGGHGGSGSTGKGKECPAGAASGNGGPPHGDDEGDHGPKNKGKDKKPEKGKSLRGGKKSDRDKWYGQNDKNFQKWWHREGKDEFNDGRDIEDSQNARDALDYWDSIGRPVPK